MTLLVRNCIWINNAIREDLTWALVKLKTAHGIHLLKSISWTEESATHIIYCDACPTGLGFWYPSNHLGFHCVAPPDPLPNTIIFFLEALCVLCALQHAHQLSPKGSRFVIYTDNLNTVSIFNSLRCLPEYNILLKEAIDILDIGHHDLRVLHVSGEKNGVADALSRQDFIRAIDLDPNIHLFEFKPYRREIIDHKVILTPPQVAQGVNIK